MEKHFFRFPILLFVCHTFLASCNRGNKKAEMSEVQKGYRLQVQGDSMVPTGNYEKAFMKYTQAAQVSELSGDSARVVYVKLQIADIYYQFNDFNEALASSVEAERFLPANQRADFIPSIYVLRGRIYTQLENYPMALKYYAKTLDVSSKPFDRLTIQNNIADVYINAEEFGKAEKVLRKVYDSEQLNDTILKARVADNLGFAIAKQGRKEGFTLMEEGRALRQSAGDDFGMVTSLLHLADAYRNHDLRTALYYANQANQLANRTRSASDRLLALEFLARRSTERAKYFDPYINLSDSLKRHDRKTKTYFADTKYDYKKNQQRLLESELKRARLQKNIAYWIAAFVIATVGGTIAVYLIIKRQRRNRWKAINEAQIRFSNRLHDEVANGLHRTMVFAETNNLTVHANVSALLSNLDEVYRKARSMSREHAWSPKPEHFANRLRELINTYTVPQHILTQGLDSMPWQELTEELRFALFTAVQELLVNMKKHSDCTHATIRFSIDEGTGRLEYGDNGKGVNETVITKNGLAIMENRIKSLKGTATFGTEAGRGFRAKIEFPI